MREPLASGAFASIYDATRAADDGELPRRAALKFLATGTVPRASYTTCATSPNREVQLAAALRSPG
ncbi:hypothetical protein LV779_23235 [Streptomyces thinghirensis]|nr:hypothetical protein [Streptomyces thinghirensis]